MAGIPFRKRVGCPGVRGFGDWHRALSRPFGAENRRMRLAVAFRPGRGNGTGNRHATSITRPLFPTRKNKTAATPACPTVWSSGKEKVPAPPIRISLCRKWIASGSRT